MRTLYHGISQLVSPHEVAGTNRPVDITRNAALLVEDGVIVGAGPEQTVGDKADSSVDLEGRAVVPGLVDSHTHAVFAGTRVDDMDRRAHGETYEQIAAAGGGIRSSVEQLHATSEEQLVREGLTRLHKMFETGTTTVEIKSGYGLEPAQELRQLRVIQDLRSRCAQDLYATALAHVVPQDATREAYIAQFCERVLSAAAKRDLAHFCDVFVEEGAFTTDEARTLAHHATTQGLGLKLHVDQLRDGQGAALAAELGALSADHLECTSDAGMVALADAGVIATILPGCAMFLGSPWPRGRALRDAGCEVAIATDCNPGSSMVTDLLLCATLAVTQCGLTLEEALWGITRGGAKALGLHDRGRLIESERADFIVVDSDDWRELLYRPASAPIDQVIAAGALAPTSDLH